MIPYERFLGQETPQLNGPDSYYHYRSVLGMVQEFPALPRWDPWTNYPHGTWMGQFSTLFDWFGALLVVLVHGRDATETQVAQVLGVYPALLGALLVVPFYLLARRLVGRVGAVVAAVALALLPGELLRRSLAGYADHHVGEVFTLLLATLGLVVAMERAHAARASPSALRVTLLWGGLAGLAVALYVLTWPPALMFLAPLGLWACGCALVEAARGEDARPMARAAALAFGVGAVLVLPFVETWQLLGWFSLSKGATWDALHVACLLAAALGILGVEAAASRLRRRGIQPRIVGAIFLLAVFAGLLLVFALDALFMGGLARGMGAFLGTRDDSPVTGAATISEARPAELLCDPDATGTYCLTDHMGVGVLLAALLVLAVGAWVLVKRRREDALLLVLALLAYGLGTAQVRFSFYLAPAVALLVGWLAARIVDWPLLRQRLKPTPAALAAGLALLLVLPGSLFPVGDAKPSWVRAGQEDVPHMQLATTQAWLWMRGSTPDAGVDLGLPLDEEPQDGYDYPDETYGVLAWWGEGHAIESVARRPPVSNPFQQGATLASLYLTERDPPAAERLLDQWTGDAGPVRYVVVTVTEATLGFRGVYPWAQEANASRAPPADTPARFTTLAPYRLENGSVVNLPTAGPAYRETMVSRLYHDDAMGLPNYRLVWEHPTRLVLGSLLVGNRPCVLTLMAERCGANVPADLARTYEPGAVVPVGRNAVAYDLEERSVVLVYERVSGARLVGNATPGAVVTASVDVLVPHPSGGAPRAFTWSTNATAGPDGRYEIVFPYSTGSPVPPAEGGTDTPVRATGAVRVGVEGGPTRSVSVPDEAVLRGLVVGVPG